MGTRTCRKQEPLKYPVRCFILRVGPAANTSPLDLHGNRTRYPYIFILKIYLYDSRTTRNNEAQRKVNFLHLDLYTMSLKQLSTKSYLWDCQIVTAPD